MTVWLWIGFIGFIAGLVILDLGLLSRRPRAISPVEARGTVALWALAAVLCTVVVHHVYDNDLFALEQTVGHRTDGPSAALQFITAFIVEVSLSLENIAVMALLITHFKVDPALRSRLLFLAIVTSLVLRGAFILVGASLLDLAWTKWLFVAILLLATWRLLVMPDETADLEHKWLVRVARRIRAAPTQHGHALFERVASSGRGAAWVATPLMVAFLATAAADFSVALDSVPAVFAITRDPFIAFASNALAILTMRSLFFALPQVGRLRFMKPALATLMVGFAAKILIKHYYDEIPTAWTLIGVGAVMMTAIGASLWSTRGQLTAAERPPALADAAEAVAVTRRNLRKIVILIIGTFILFVAAPLIGALPGPGGIFVAAFGLGILATEFVWARRLLHKLKTQGQFMQDTTDTIAAKTPPWAPPLVIAAFALALWRFVHLVPTINALFWLSLHRFWPPHHGPLRPRIFYLASIGVFLALGYWAYSSIAFSVRRRRSSPSP
jgi:tellurite resistance protein TerC